jgi:hypothetical protein
MYEFEEGDAISFTTICRFSRPCQLIGRLFLLALRTYKPLKGILPISF